jgi:hypothetical protein
LVGDLDGLGELASLDVMVEHREEVLHGDWLRWRLHEGRVSGGSASAQEVT